MDPKTLPREPGGAAAAGRHRRKGRRLLLRTFLPLLTSLAEKRTKDLHALNDYLDAGKEGLFKAAMKYTPGEGAERFHIFVVDFIDEAMTRHDKGDGFWSRLFGR